LPECEKTSGKPALFYLFQGDKTVLAFGMSLVAPLMMIVLLVRYRMYGMRSRMLAFGTYAIWAIYIFIMALVLAAM
jgi:hypothetical protein